MREISQERLNKDVRRVLDNPLWPSGLHADEVYSRIHDDHDGTRQGILSVYFEPHTGDAFVQIDIHHGLALRFRTEIGGTQSPRVHNALRILAKAIQLDNEARPDGNPNKQRSETG